MTHKKIIHILPNEHKEYSTDTTSDYYFSLATNASLVVRDSLKKDMRDKSHIAITLDGPGATAEIFGMFYGEETDFLDMVHSIEHNAPNCRSRILTKGVLDGKSHANYTSSIHIKPTASNSIAEERADTILLSKHASINAIPDLKIEHNQVVCSHAVTTSRINKEKLFYFASRGIEEKEAVAAMVQGHFASVQKPL